MLYYPKYKLIEPDSIKSIANPLQNVGIVGFFFVRMYPDGCFVNLASDPVWTEFFFNKFYSQAYSPNAMVNHVFMSNGISLSELNPENQNWQDGKEYFNLGNAITLSKQFEHYHESYYFYSQKDNFSINQFYLGHIDLLYSFVDYFKKKAGPLILKGEAQKFYTPEKYLSQRPNLYDLQADTQSQQLMNIFSPKETECLYYLVQGKTAEETAIILNRSKRTVEQHIQSAKEKLNCHKISQLAYQLGKLDAESYRLNNKSLSCKNSYSKALSSLFTLSSDL